MDPVQLAEEFTSALEAGDLETAASYLADDFQFTSAVLPEPQGAQEWLGLSQVLKMAFPDLSYNFEVLGGEGDTVRVRSRLTGTHNGDLDLTWLGMGVVPATGIAISTPPEESEGRVENGKVASIHLHSSPDSGLFAAFSQLGIEMPMG